MEDKEIIIEFLTKSGFNERGLNQYYREGTGTIFVREWSVLKVMWQIMELGKKHHARDLRDILYFKDAVEISVFNPQV